MNIVKARAAVEFLARQYAAAMDAVDRAEQRITEAAAELEDAKQRHRNAELDATKAAAAFTEAEAQLNECQQHLASANGQASGSAYNPMIRIEETPPTTEET